MRRIFGALLALLLAAPSYSQVRAAAATVAPVSAAAAVPLMYRVQLGNGDAAAAQRFIADVPALSWYAQNRPADLAPMLMAAHQVLDVRATASYAADPVQLRRALVARSDSPLFAAPGQVMGAVGADPSLAPSAPAFAEAVLEWGALKDNQRAALSRKGLDAAKWAETPLAERLSTLRAIYAALWEAKTAGLAPGGDRYLQLLDAYLTTAGPYLPAREEAEMREHRTRVRKLHARLAQARKKIADLADEKLAASVERIAGTKDVDQAEAALGKLFDGLTPAPAPSAAGAAPRVRSVPAPAADFYERVAELMPAAMARVTRGTEAGAMLEALDAGPSKTRVEIGKSAAGSSAHFAQLNDVIVLNKTHLTAFLRWQNLTPEQFLGSPGAQVRFAVLIAPVYVHEATHRRQALASDRKGISRRIRTRLYSQSDEEESFMAQGLIARRLAERPNVKEWLAQAAVAGPELNSLTHHWQMLKATPEQVAAHVREHYEATAGEHTARSRAISYAQADAERLAPYVRLAAAELARRSRLPAVERDALARLPAVTAAAPASAYSTGALRDMLRRADATGHAGLIRYYGYLDGLKHSRAALSAAISRP